MNVNFDRKQFFPLKNKLYPKDLVILLKDTLINYRFQSIDSIEEISSLNNVRNNSVLFINKNNKFSNKIEVNIITDDKNIFNDSKFKNIFLVKDIDYSYNLITNELFLHEDNLNFKDEFKLYSNSYISKFAFIDENVNIHNNCVIGRGTVIGKKSIIKSGSIIKNSIVGELAIFGEGCIIGSTGFGFNLMKMGSDKLNPHIGIVYIDNNVSIGANCTIDRAKIDITYVGKNSMLDNQIHIGHNVSIGSNTCIAAQTGISGSTIIGNNVVIGGQSGFAGHINIGNGCIIAAKSGVTKSLANNSRVAGFPAIDIKEWKKNIIRLKNYGHK